MPGRACPAAPRPMEASSSGATQGMSVWVPWALPSVLSQSMHCHIAHHQTPPPQPSGKNLGIEVTLQFLERRAAPPKQQGEHGVVRSRGVAMRLQCPSLASVRVYVLTAHGHCLPTSNTSCDAQGDGSNPTASIFLGTP